MVLRVAVAGKRNCFLQYFFSFMQMHVPLSSSFLLMSSSSPLDLGYFLLSVVHPSLCTMVSPLGRPLTVSLLFFVLFPPPSLLCPFLLRFLLSLSSGSLLPSLFFSSFLFVFGFLFFCFWFIPSSFPSLLFVLSSPSLLRSSPFIGGKTKQVCLLLVRLQSRNGWSASDPFGGLVGLRWGRGERGGKVFKIFRLLFC